MCLGQSGYKHCISGRHCTMGKREITVNQGLRIFVVFVSSSAGILMAFSKKQRETGYIY